LKDVAKFRDPVESFKNMDTEYILQTKYLKSRNDFQLVRDQLLPKPNLR
jgi:hypothetical protein